MGLVLDEPVELLLVEGVDDVEGVEGVLEDEEGEDEDEGAAPVSSTFFPQAPSASRAARATAVAAAGLNLDACMFVPFMKNEKSKVKVNLSIGELAERQPDINLAAPCGYAP
ncbi:hypothetical protein [Polaromonas sp. LjRoot131]|uniref:hypothetical protein n=1 Tax=Polaromonas sp. LjRoot131 TaxID=3342262 RepID=UPI003ED0C25A